MSTDVHDHALAERADTSPSTSQPTLVVTDEQIQAFGTVRLFPIALSQEARLESCQLLNRVLADSMVLYSLYKKHHWEMRGPTFYQLHLLLDAHAGAQLELLDVLAERIQALGGVAVADPRLVAELTGVRRAPDGVEPVPAMLSRLLQAHEIIIEQLRAAIVRADRSGDAGTSDLLGGDVLRTHESQVWFLAEHLVDTPVVAPIGVSADGRAD